MIRGLDRFRDHFAAYTGRYVLIGGTACSIALAEADLEFRATKDLDIVLCLEALDVEFAEAFWAFVKEGGYENRRKSTGERVFYRFDGPVDDSWPHTLELFSRVPDVIYLEGVDAYLTPIPIDEEVASLSAILLDDGYYEFVHAGCVVMSGVTVMPATHLIPLKSRAWLDLERRRAEGKPIREPEVNKHKNDIARLYPLLAPDVRVPLSAAIEKDMQAFVARIEAGEPFDIRKPGVGRTTKEQMIANLQTIYGLGS